ncbi:hypothetical protein [Nocardia testacea]|uniref:hypothetical protein n=1 Tax=Nocardia testacea TaxID=248551 RepID=UPI003A86754E
MEPSPIIRDAATQEVRRQFVCLTAHIVSGSEILAEFTDPPADPGNIYSRLAEVGRAGAANALDLRTFLEASGMELPQRAEACCLSFLLEFTVEHIEISAHLAAIHDVIALPDELLIAVEALQGCAGAALRFIAGPGSDTRQDHNSIALAAMTRFAVEASTGPFHSVTEHREMDVATREVGDAIGHAARCLGHAAKLLPVINALP